jgi:hypothetical protein
MALASRTGFDITAQMMITSLYNRDNVPFSSIHTRILFHTGYVESRPFNRIYIWVQLEV